MSIELGPRKLDRVARLMLYASGYEFPDARDAALRRRWVRLARSQFRARIAMVDKSEQRRQSMTSDVVTENDPYNTADSSRWQRPDLGDPGRRYLGNVHGQVQRVHGDGLRAPLDPRLDLVRHSSAGFGWGYGGSSPAQLAIAMLADATGDDETARAHYYAFKWEVISKLEHGKPFELSSLEVRTWLSKRQQQRNTGKNQHGR